MHVLGQRKLPYLQHNVTVACSVVTCSLHDDGTGAAMAPWTIIRYHMYHVPGTVRRNR